MNTQKCLDLLREIRDVAFATVSDDGRPKIRIIDIMISENEKLYFCTARGKDFYKQLLSSGEVAITGMTKSYQMIRLNGIANKMEDQKLWIDRIFEENPSMNDVYPGTSRYILEPFCIARGEVEFFDLGQTPIVRETFCLGDAEKSSEKFLITDLCTGCGICSNICPQKCIEKEKRYTINQRHCLHCGLCFEECPVGAIESRNT